MTLLFVFIFVAMLAVVGTATWAAYSALVGAPRKDRLDALSGEGEMGLAGLGEPMPALLHAGVREGAPEPGAVGRMAEALGRRAASAGLKISGASLIALTVGCGAAGALLGWFLPVLIFRGVSAAAGGVVLAMAPIAIVNYKRDARLRLFEEQFPEALDFIARALRAGHAFSVSLEMLASEAPEPLCAEFRRVFQELNLGAAVETALTGMAERVPLLDVHFFVSAVLLQRETGGNLSEILTNLAHTVRERFRLKGHVRSATAHARITATVLTMLPLITLIGLQIRAPGYVRGFVTDPDGPYLLLGALAGQIAGYLLMKRLIDFRI